MRGVSIETMDGQDQTTVAMQLLYKCLKDGRIEPNTVALIRTVLGHFPDQTPPGRPVDVVARELVARWDAIALVEADNERLRSVKYASRKLVTDRKNIRKWRQDPEHENRVKKFYDEYMAGPQDD